MGVVLRPRDQRPSLERIDALYSLPRHKVGRDGQKDAQASDQQVRERVLEDQAAAGGNATQVEVVKDPGRRVWRRKCEGGTCPDCEAPCFWAAHGRDAR